jgi:hypothetical protein
MQLTISSRRDIAVLQKESSSLEGEEDVKALSLEPSRESSKLIADTNPCEHTELSSNNGEGTWNSR